MPRYILTAIFCFIIFVFTKANNFSDTSGVLGRWDITMKIGEREFPSWLEIHRSGIKMLVGEFVGAGGSARPISRVDLENGRLRFSIPPQWESQDKNLEFEGNLQGDSLVGTIVLPDGRNCKFSAVKAPSLTRTTKPVWDKPVKLFNGKDLKGWHPSGKTNQWVVENGILKSPKAGSNIISDETFNDFKLHVEFRYQAHGNSGVYLRGRYEVQITDHYPETPPKDVLGSIYGFIKPNEKVTTKPNEWNSFDITLVGRNVTIVLNGKTIVNNQEIPGITGGALNSREGEPGPIMLQGDHEPIEYRNIIITRAK
jgi:Domain of Unknown Function (DUF1080)